MIQSDALPKRSRPWRGRALTEPIPFSSKLDATAARHFRRPLYLSRTTGAMTREFADLHKRLWSSGKGFPPSIAAPLAISNCFAARTIRISFLPVANRFVSHSGFCDLGSRIAAAEAWWNAERIRNGTLWDDPDACRLMLSAQKAAHRKLVEVIRNLNDELNQTLAHRPTAAAVADNCPANSLSRRTWCSGTANSSECF